MQHNVGLAERRAGGRKDVCLEGRLRLRDGTYLPCTVRSISAMGAGIELASETFVPLTFRLQILTDLFDVECELRNRQGNFIGVEFTSSRAEAMARYG